MGLTAILSPHPLNWQGRAAARKRSRIYELLTGHAVFDGRDPCSGYGCITSSPRTPAVYATVCPCKLAANKLYWQFDTSVQKRDGFCRPSFVFRVIFLERMYQVANTDTAFATCGGLTRWFTLEHIERPMNNDCYSSAFRCASYAGLPLLCPGVSRLSRA
jgi:hypothetical protein